MDTGINLNGQQLLVTSNETPRLETAPATPSAGAADESGRSTGHGRQPKPGKDKKMSDRDVPEVALPSHGSVVVLRVMPDDNSCLFRAFNSAFFGPMDNDP